MPPLSVIIKPASGRCNLRCRYCFYADETENRETPDFGMMDEWIAEQLVIKSLAFAEGSCSFGFQGGEPTMRGLPFFRRFVELVERHNHKKLPIYYMLQTNGTLIDENWAAFFAKNRFFIGLSLDGDKGLHDLNRVDAAGKGSFSKVVRAGQLLRRASVDFNLLTVVTRQTARNIQRLYGFFMKNGFVHQQYIPCLDPLNVPRGGETYSLSPRDYEQYLFRLFDLWYRDRLEGRYVYIRYFENLAGMLLGESPESCSLRGQCTRQLVTEADGSAYPCDFYMLDSYCLGNFCNDSVEEMMNHPKARLFREESALVHSDCLNCPVALLCRGGCRRNRQADTLHETGLNYYCSAYKAFLPYAAPKIAELLKMQGVSF